MKALTIHSPWANAIAFGEKTIECRSWRTRYRGPLLICASNRKPKPVDGVIIPYGFVPRLHYPSRQIPDSPLCQPFPAQHLPFAITRLAVSVDKFRQ